jgi:hypothetical protein
MIFAPLITLILLLGFQEPAYQEPKIELDRLCGKLVHVDRNAGKQKDFYQDKKTKPLAHVELALYPRKPNDQCCQTDSPVASVRTGRGGDFRFKKQISGTYWLVARWGGHSYNTPVILHPAKSKDDFCSNAIFEIDHTGKFTYAITVTVE